MAKLDGFTKKRFELLKNFQKKWVAFSADKNRIIASGKTIKEVDQKLHGTREKASVISYVMPFDRHFVPHVYKNKV